MTSCADLHVHSRYSNRPSEWLLRRIGAPECFTEPQEVYAQCRAKGMSFVTISDHNRIEGALDIAHLPGTFISSEVTTYFPEDGCKIHCLVLGIDEEQHREIDEVRRNIYEFRDYLLDHRIAHSVAHPLFSVNDRLTVEHFERLLVLFKHFEGINGARAPRAAVLTRVVLDNLSPKFLDKLANRYDLDPRSPEPWRKSLTGGSDDHSALYIADAYTETPPAETVDEFIGHLRDGATEAKGSHGSSLKMARNFYSIAYRFYRERLLGTESGDELFAEVFSRLLNGESPLEMSRAERLRQAAQRFIRPRKKKMGQVDKALVSELVEWASMTDESPSDALEERSFRIASGLSHQLAYASLRRSARYLSKGKLTESLQTISSLGPVGVCIAPYLAAFQTQHKDEKLHQAVAVHHPSARLLARQGDKKAWFTDSLQPENGVVNVAEICTRLAEEHQKELVVLTSQKQSASSSPLVRNFDPVGQFELPEYHGQPICLPPFLDIIEYCEREKVCEAIVSSPGPLGLVGLAAARLLGLRVTGIYQTDFPLHALYLTGSPIMEEAAWRYMRWFYGQMDVVYAPSNFYVERLKDRGFEADRLRLLPRGVDREHFNPDKRDTGFWSRYGLEESFKFLYVGRISKEKNLDALLRAFMTLLGEGHDASLVLVGEGPYLDELRERYPRPEILFTGYLGGDDLAVAYASADAFVSASTSDTFGNAALEAQASGLPAIVSDEGGAREIVADASSGWVVDVFQAGQLESAMRKLLDDVDTRARMAERSVKQAQRSSWEALVQELWDRDDPLDVSEDTLLFSRIPRSRSSFIPELHL
jgi:glycosyltransferase involved in cell wall biosynthesis